MALLFKTSSPRALRVMRVLRSMRFFSGIKTICLCSGRASPNGQHRFFCRSSTASSASSA